MADYQDQAFENFVSEKKAPFYAKLYKKFNLKGGHVILLNPESSPFYQKTKAQAIQALNAYPGGLQVGGGINDRNAEEFLEAGASHIIVTSFVFKNGKVEYGNLEKLLQRVGKEHLTLDLSCRKRDGKYYIVTDRWQNFTDVELTAETLNLLCGYCDEFLIHAVDVEGKASGIETELVKLLGDWGKIPITYAGGVGSYEDLERLKNFGKDLLDVTIGSALDLFGGNMNFENVLKLCEN